mgnify:CR=1 FL=1
MRPRHAATEAPPFTEVRLDHGYVEAKASRLTGTQIVFDTVTVTGTENVEFGVPRLAANGASMRINYMIDGNTNTEKDRAGLRLLPISEVMVQEIKVVTTGFPPEFGQTMGMVYNAITPSGTNAFASTSNSRTTPANGAGTSIVALSDSSVTRPWSLLTVSPTCTSKRELCA